MIRFDTNNYSAARAGMNGFVRGEAVVEGKQASAGLPFERAVKLQEASEGTDGFFRVSKDVYLLANLQIVETERNAVMTKLTTLWAFLTRFGRNGEPIALAVPVQSLVDFVSKAQPCLAQSIFPSTMGISPVSGDLYPKFAPPPRSHALRHRSEDLSNCRL